MSVLVECSFCKGKDPLCQHCAGTGLIEFETEPPPVNQDGMTKKEFVKSLKRLTVLYLLNHRDYTAFMDDLTIETSEEQWEQVCHYLDLIQGQRHLLKQIAQRDTIIHNLLRNWQPAPAPAPHNYRVVDAELVFDLRQKIARLEQELKDARTELHHAQAPVLTAGGS